MLKAVLFLIYDAYYDKKISEQDCRDRLQTALTENAAEAEATLLAMSRGKIQGLTDKELLQLAEQDIVEYVHLCNMMGTTVFGGTSSGKIEDSQVKEVLRKLLSAMGLEKLAIDTLIQEVDTYPDFEDEPIEAVWDYLLEENYIAGIDWKFALEDVEFNFNNIAEKLGLPTVPAYPSYVEGQALGMLALEQICKEQGRSALAIEDGDSFTLLLAPEENLPALEKAVQKWLDLAEWSCPIIRLGS